MALEKQKCVSCEGGIEPLKQEEAERMLKEVPGWELKGDTIERTLKFPNFVTAMRFANKITNIAEEENHHPDLHISYGKMRIELSTHKIGGLSQNDFIMAAKINKLMDETQEAQAI